MSNIYIQEPPTQGKVLLETSVGDIEIELWSREAPKACRNFVQLCLERYYDKTKFHRVVKDFIVQGGDPTGTGQGGESVYGQPFRDEFHSRLRFVRRGLVGMANAGKDDNGSQFFFTLGPTQELQNKHTLFGKVVGDTIYNMIKLQDLEVGPDDRPLHPPKILKTKVLINPFDDIVPRKAIESMLDEEDKKAKKKPKSNMKATKDFKLLSFGEEAEEDEEETIENAKHTKVKSSHDVLDDPKLLKESGIIPKTTVELEPQDEQKIQGDVEKLKETSKIDMDSLRDKLKKPKKDQKRPMIDEPNEVMDDQDDYEDAATRQKRRKAEIRKEIKALKKELLNPQEDDKESNKEEKKSKLQSLTEEEKKNDLLIAFHEQKEKYKSKPKSKKGSKREAETLAMLDKFKQKLFEESQKPEVQGDDDSDNDENWMNHTLKFESDDPVLAKDASTKDDDWFDIYDPRNPINKRRRQNDAKASKK